MQCPKCVNAPLKRGTFGSNKLILDQCLLCKGIWFDKGEICTLLGNKAHHDFTIAKLGAEMPKTLCPCCNVSLYEFCYPGTLTLVDGCRQCHGVWLDNSEWKAISHARDESMKISCPKCHVRQHPAVSCNSCGIIIAKYNESSPLDVQDKKVKNTESSYADDIPGLKGSLLRNIDITIKALTERLF